MAGRRRIAVMGVTAASAWTLAATVPAVAQDTAPPAYLDDRSDGEALVRSLYNAIARKEYVRAYSYFGNAAGRADFATFAEGYEDTENVTLRFGDITEEGAAGSLYWSVPVAVSARSNEGARQVLTGCYTVRLAQPANQAEPPFEPLHIESAHLAVSETSLEEVVPDCETP